MAHRLELVPKSTFSPIETQILTRSVLGEFSGRFIKAGKRQLGRCRHRSQHLDTLANKWVPGQAIYEVLAGGSPCAERRVWVLCGTFGVRKPGWRVHVRASKATIWDW